MKHYDAGMIRDLLENKEEGALLALKLRNEKYTAIARGRLVYGPGIVEYKRERHGYVKARLK